MFCTEMDHRYAKIKTPLPSAPRMNTGLRPIRSDKIAYRGWRSRATALTLDVARMLRTFADLVNSGEA